MCNNIVAAVAIIIYTMVINDIYVFFVKTMLSLLGLPLSFIGVDEYKSVNETDSLHDETIK